MSRPKGRRRLPAMTRRALRHANRDLRHQLDGAGIHIAALEAKLAAHDETDKRRDEADRARHAQKATDTVDVSVLQKQLAVAEKANGDLNGKYLAVKADLENATAIDVPPMERDTDGLDQITEPIYAALWQQQFAEQKQAAPEVKTLTDALGGAR